MSKEQLDVKVEFSNLSVGQDVARLGVKIHRANMDSKVAEMYLCGSRLRGQITIEDPSASDLPGVPDIPPVEATFDVKGYGANRKSFRCGLTFAIGDVDVEKLSHFPNKKGRIVAERTGGIPEKARGRKPKA